MSQRARLFYWSKYTQDRDSRKSRKVSQLESIHSEQSESTSTQFLLAEFAEMGQFWRHTDSRIETAINFYLTIGTVLLPGVVLLYQVIMDIPLFILAVLPIAGVLFIVGVLLIGRITNADIRKAEYLLSMNLSRRFFADRDPTIVHYIFFPTPQPSNRPEVKFEQLRPYFHKQLVFAVNVVNSILIGGIVSGVVWLAMPNSISLAMIMLIGLCISVTSFAVLTWLYQKRIRPYRAPS